MHFKDFRFYERKNVANFTKYDLEIFRKESLELQKDAIKNKKAKLLR